MLDTMQQQLATAPESYAFLGSLISGIFARKDAKKAAKLAEEAAKVPLVVDSTTDHEVDLDGMNAAAIKAGYNPMTLLNAGGLAAFTKTKNWSSTTGHNAMAAAQARGAVPSMGSVFAGAAAQTLDMATSAFIAPAFKAALPMTKSFFPPAPVGGGGMADAMGWGTLGRTAGGAKVAGSAGFVTGMNGKPALKGLGSPVAPTAGEPTVTNPYDQYRVDPTVRDTEIKETRSGDWSGALYGFWVDAQDLAYNYYNKTWRERSSPNYDGGFDGAIMKEMRQTEPTVSKVMKQGLPSVVQGWHRIMTPGPAYTDRAK